MPRKTNEESAAKYVHRILSTHPDRELSMDDLVAAQGSDPVHNRNALHNATSILVGKGSIVRTVDAEENRSYWALNLQAEEAPAAKGKVKTAAPAKINVIKSGRY